MSWAISFSLGESYLNECFGFEVFIALRMLSFRVSLSLLEINFKTPDSASSKMFSMEYFKLLLENFMGNFILID